MGSGSSRMAPRPPRPRPDNRPKLGLASFLCGGASSSSSSSSSSSQMEDQASEKLLVPPRFHDSIPDDNLRHLVKESPSSFSSENCSSSSMNENAQTSESGKCFSENKDLVPCLVNGYSGFDTPRSEASTSSKSSHREPLLTNTDTNVVSVIEVDDYRNQSVSQSNPVRFSSNVLQLETGDMPAAAELTADNPSSEVLGIQDSSPNSASGASILSSSSNLLGEEPLLEATPGADFLTLGERRNGSVLHVDVVSISSNILPSGNGDISNDEAQRNSRRLFWDAFSRRSTGRNHDSPAVISSTEVPDDLGSHDRWLVDIGDDLFGGRLDHDSVYLHRRSHGSSGRRWHSRSEIRERLRGGFDDDSRRATICPSGLHPDGACSCDSLLTAEESSTRASISRIVMLAEALFEVLDEIHRQPVSLSLSMVSLPAPESVVDSLPIKNHIKHDAAGSVDDVEQCYICLAEYEQGDKIRILPCRHEYHMSCVDKWLKEIHGVCPLCRGDVCEGAAESSMSNL